ncbi:Crp/Fnr family transcriptional regulator [Aquiflexum sp.]|uniref:Crp/Fnr family transcriptional regulator n=1 Tax=Aquiflexum sp. TaxID=1872584 RepID=UPI003592FB99
MTPIPIIYQHPLFSPDTLRKISDAHQLIHIPKGTYLLKEGQLSMGYHCVESGLIRTYALDPNGNDITVDFIGQNEIAIEVVSLFQGVAAKENIQALTECTCWYIGYEDFQKLFHTIEGFTEWGRNWMTQQLFKVKQRSISMITESASDRYITLQKEHPEIIQQAPLKYIASFLGITDTSLSRIRAEISKTGT